MALYENFIAAISRRWKIPCEFICAMFSFILIHLKCFMKILLLFFFAAQVVWIKWTGKTQHRKLWGSKLLTFSNINFFIASYLTFRQKSLLLHEIRLCLLFGNWNSYFALNFNVKYLCLNASRSESILNINFQATTLRHLWP